MAEMKGAETKVVENDLLIDDAVADQIELVVADESYRFRHHDATGVRSVWGRRPEPPTVCLDATACEYLPVRCHRTDGDWDWQAVLADLSWRQGRLLATYHVEMRP